MIQYITTWWDSLPLTVRVVLGWCALAVPAGMLIGKIIKQGQRGPEEGCTPHVFPEAGKTRAERMDYVRGLIPPERQATIIPLNPEVEQLNALLKRPAFREADTDQTMIRDDSGQWRRPRPAPEAES